MKAEVIKSLNNPMVKHFVKLQKDRLYRTERSEYVLEGAKLLKEALSAGAEIKTVFYREEYESEFGIGELEEMDGVRLYRADGNVIGRISDVKAPQGIIFSCRMPDTSPPAVFRCENAIILDGIADPGNMGTILRTADAFGVGAVILTGAYTDPYSPKVVRSAMGSLFRVTLFFEEPEKIKQLLEESSVPVLSAVPSDDAKCVTELDIAHAAVVIGNEAHGVSEKMKKISAGTVSIPMRGKTESLNAAVSAAIIMWEMTKRR